MTGVPLVSVLLDPGSSASRRRVRGFNLGGTGSVRPTEKEVGVFVASSGGTSAGVGEGGGGVSTQRPMLPKTTF
jgi:hypothetical protein